MAQPVFILISLTTSLFLYYLINRMGKKRCEFTNWPLVGMSPGLISNLHRFQDKVTEILCERGGTYWFKGVWFSNMDLLFTSHPDDIQHIFNKNFSNYRKGPEFGEKFGTLGNGILNTDGELWQVLRRSVLSVMNGVNLYNTLDACVWEKIESGLIPVMNHFCETGDDFDLEDVFQRFTFDIVGHLVMNQDPGCLSIGLPNVPCQRAIVDVLPVIFQRHLLPRGIWKLKRWLKMGSEKKFLDSSKAMDDFACSYFSGCGDGEPKDPINFFSNVVSTYQKNRALFSNELSQVMKDSLLGFIFASSDTTSTTLTWFFWLIAGNPAAKSTILEEMERELGIKQDDRNSWRIFTMEECRRLVYLQGALSESLRLFPPLPMQYRSPTEADSLPSGYNIHPNTQILISFYSVGRMEKYWGSDCLEFKPERWITSRGTLKSIPTYMFPAFNLGPRVCPGKEMAFAQMKMAVATLLYHYDINVVKEQEVKPKASVILHMKHGLKVVVSKKKEG